MTIYVDATELQYVEGSSDKFYRVYQWGSDWAIQYGRNGTYGSFSRKKAGSETDARIAADKQLQSKYAKGYETTKTKTLEFSSDPSDNQLDTAMKGPGGPRVTDRDVASALESFSKIIQDTDDEPDPELWLRVKSDLSMYKRAESPMVAGRKVRPMLAETLASSDLEWALTNDDIIGQYKLDGERYVIEVDEGKVAVYNRQGQPKTSNVAPETLAPFFNLVEGYWVIDGELIGRTFWAFDMPAAGGWLEDDAPYVQRLSVLASTLRALHALDSPSVCLLPEVVGTEDKRLLLKQAADDQREGVIFRNRNARYQPGRRSKDLLKHKFIKEADVFVTQVGVKGKDNAELAVYRDDSPVVVGQASTIGKGAIQVGDVLEVKFLYVLDPENPRMYQPRILRKRTDKSAKECSIAQFVNAGTNKEVK